MKLFFRHTYRAKKEKEWMRNIEGTKFLLRYWNRYVQSHREQTITAYFYFILFSTLWKPRTNVYFFLKFFVFSFLFISSFARSLPLEMCFQLRLFSPFILRLYIYYFFYVALRLKWNPLEFFRVRIQFGLKSFDWFKGSHKFSKTVCCTPYAIFFIVV